MNNIAKYRGLKNYSQKDFADLLKITRPGLSFIENGNVKNINHELLRKMSIYLDISPVRLLGEENFKYVPKTQEDIDYIINLLEEKKGTL